LFEVMMTTGRWTRPDRLAGLVDVELHPVEFLQEVVRELDVGLVDLVDQEDDLCRCLEGLPELALADVVAHVVDPRLAQLAVAQPAHRVVFVEPLLRPRRRLDVPFDQGKAERGGHLPGEFGLAGSGLSLHQKRPFEGHRRVDGNGQVVGRDIRLGTGKFHVISGLSRGRSQAR
jgi:hypothetical protein